jgi:Fur family transcriptional regulator, peroxide stress response regulator
MKLSKEMPTLSKTSIYNTLKSFVSAGAVHEVMIEENLTRYDAFMGRHAHFKCSICGKLQDIGLGCLSCANSGRLNDNKVLEEHIYMVGICAECAKKDGVKENGKKIKARG